MPVENARNRRNWLLLARVCVDRLEAADSFVRAIDEEGEEWSRTNLS